MHTHKRVKSMKTEAITNKVLYKTDTYAHYSKHTHPWACTDSTSTKILS